MVKVFVGQSVNFCARLNWYKFPLKFTQVRQKNQLPHGAPRKIREKYSAMSERKEC